jgi:uncharacterized protein involved in exopolysaccharide biosynthesis
MPDIFYLISRWWKQMLVTGIISVGIVAVIVFLQPRQYLSVATALPANPVKADKGAVFNENIEGLYSNLGSPDDLNPILGTSRLDTIYLAVTDQFNLADHYKITNNAKARRKAAAELKANTEVIKSEYGELKVKVWDTDKNLAPQLANAIMDLLSSTYQALHNRHNQEALKNLQAIRTKIMSEMDSIKLKPGSANTSANSDSYERRINQLSKQLENYDKLYNEYHLMLDNKASVLMLVEKATPSMRPDKPKRLQLMIAAAFAAFVFALLVAVIMERKSEGR